MCVCLFFFPLLASFVVYVPTYLELLAGDGRQQKKKKKKKHALEFQTIFRDRTSKRTNAPCQRVGAGSSLSLLGC